MILCIRLENKRKRSAVSSIQVNRELNNVIHSACLACSSPDMEAKCANLNRIRATFHMHDNLEI